MAVKLSFIEQVQTKQPLGEPKIDWSNPITRGLVSAISLNGTYDSFGRNMSLVSGATLAPSKNEIGISTNGSSSYGLISLPLKQYSELTLVAVTVPSALTTSDTVVGLGNSSDSNPIFRITTGNSDASKVRFWVRGDNSGTLNFTGDSTNTAFVVGKRSVVSFYARGSDGPCYCYIDGIKDTVTTSTLATTFTIDRLAIGTSHFGGTTADFYSGNTSLALMFNRELKDWEHKKLAENPWQIFEPEQIPLFKPTVTAQYARPISDVSAGGWTASTGSDLFAMLDETSANDSDYITSTTASTCEVALGSLSDPALSTGHIVRYRISATGGGITVRLRQGTTTIATWTHDPAPGSLTTYAQTLSGGEADSISNYSALKLQFEATA